MITPAVSKYTCAVSFDDMPDMPLMEPSPSAAPRKTSATVDQPHAARVPMDTSVSMVAVPWRRLITAARWKPHPL